MQRGKPSVGLEAQEKKQFKWISWEAFVLVQTGLAELCCRQLFFLAFYLALVTGNSQALLVSPLLPHANNCSAVRFPLDLQVLKPSSRPWATFPSGCFHCPPKLLLDDYSMSGCKLMSHCPALSVGSGSVFAIWVHLERLENLLAHSFPQHSTALSVPACSGMCRWN